MEKFFYFIRHGLTESNATKTVQGLDDPLTEHGEKQASVVGNKLKLFPIDIIYTSDLPRAYRTAELVNETLQKEIITSKLLREEPRPSSLFGVHQNDPRADVYYRSLRASEDPNWRYGDEETFAEIIQRAEDCLDFLLQSQCDHNLVVTHGNFLRRMIGFMLFGHEVSPSMGWKMTKFLNTKNTGITTCHYEEGEWRLLTWNDYAHLSEIT